MISSGNYSTLDSKQGVPVLETVDLPALIQEQRPTEVIVFIYLSLNCRIMFQVIWTVLMSRSILDVAQHLRNAEESKMNNVILEL